MRARPDRKPVRFILLVSQLGICMLTAIFICAWIGLYLCNITGKEWIFPLLLLVGIMAGFRSCYQIISRFVNLKERAGEDPLVKKMKGEE